MAPSARLPRRLWSLAEMPSKDVLAEAEAYFRRVPTFDPASDEATLRLGRVLAERDRHVEALAALAPLLHHGRDPWLEYLARLFAGSVCQDLGRHDEAIAHYAEAIALQPGAQSARVALSHAQRQAGRLPASAASAEEAFSIRADRWYDPWLEYHHGQSRHLGDLLERLRKEAVR